MIIQFIDDNGATVETVDATGRTKDECVVLAQGAMSLFGVTTAYVVGDETLTVVSVATEWQKRNG